MGKAIYNLHWKKKKIPQLKACKRHNLAAGATQGKIAYTQTLEKLILKSSK
jgi:hypothetical protein